MEIYNTCDEAVKSSYLEKIFHETLPPKEIYEYIYEHTFLFKRDDGFVIKLSFLDFEMDAYVSVYRQDRTIICLIYHYADFIKALDDENKIFEIISTCSDYNPVGSKTILSLTHSPILEFHDLGNKEIRATDIVLTELMVLFDDFNEIKHHETSGKSYNFICQRMTEVVELSIAPTSGKLSLAIKSEGIVLCSLDLANCDRMMADLEKKKLYFTSGFEELQHLSFIKCTLDLNEHLVLLVEPNAKPSLRGLG